MKRPFGRACLIGFLGPAILAILIVVLASWLWSRTGDILGDFGHELYVSQQLAQHKVLYRDVAYQYGALSPAFNALLMKIFGPSITTLRWANLAILAAATILLYRLLRRASDPFSAFVATAFFLVVFAFGCATRITHYNFLTPYAHAVTHGFLLCLLCIEFILLFARRGQLIYALAAGATCGLAFLTKPEIFLACAATLFLGLLAAIRIRRQNPLAILGAALAMLAVPAVALAILAPLMDFSTALNGIAGGWQYTLAPYVTGTQFNRENLGILHPLASLKIIAGMTAIDLAVLLAIIALAMIVRQRPALESIAAAAAGAGICGIIIRSWRPDMQFFWIDADRPLILAGLALFVLCACRILKFKPNENNPPRALAQWTLAVLSLFLLARIALNVRTYHFGFVLAAPVTALSIALLLAYLPDLIQQRGGSAWVIRFGILGILAGLMTSRLVEARALLQERTLTLPLAQGGSIQARPIDTPSLQAVRWLAAAPPDFTAAAWPAGAGIVYAANRQNPTPYDDLEPMILKMWGEPNVIRACRAHPPSAILLLRVDMSDAGGKFFGQDYAVDLFHWIQQNYRHVATFGPANQFRCVDVWLRN